MPAKELRAEPFAPPSSNNVSQPRAHGRIPSRRHEPTSDPRITASEVARRLHVSSSAVRSWTQLRDNPIPFDKCIRNGSARFVFVWSQVEEWWKALQTPARCAER